MKPAADLVLVNCSQVITAAGRRPPVDRETLGVIDNGAVACLQGRICWVGPETDLASSVDLPPETRKIDAAGGTLLPGLIDCHTHAIFAGDRASEFALRTRGKSYREIASQGGGIMKTARETRSVTEEKLVELALPRLAAMLRRGVTTVEIKSGYGLETASELKMLRAASTLASVQPARIAPTFLGAHAIPPEFAGKREDYVALVCDVMLPRVAAGKLAAFCDVFLEDGAFTEAEARRVLEKAGSLGLGLKLHADQLTAGGGAEVAAELGATSADHLEHASDRGIQALARAGTVAVLLPAATVFLGKKDIAPARKMLDAGVRVALSTDFNPGSSPTDNLPLMTTLGCGLLRMTVEESIFAVTAAAAKALRLENEAGSIRSGLAADIAVFPIPSYEHIPYAFGSIEASVVLAGGSVVLQQAK